MLTAQLEAEKLAWAEKQQVEGSVIDPLTKARAANAAIGDAADRRRHSRLLVNAERFVAQLADVPAAGPHVGKRPSGVAAGLVCDTKKVTADVRLRRQQDQRRERRAAQTVGRDAAWRQHHLANPKPQTKWRDLSRKHKVAKCIDRRKQA